MFYCIQIFTYRVKPSLVLEYSHKTWFLLIIFMLNIDLDVKIKRAKNPRETTIVNSLL